MPTSPADAPPADAARLVALADRCVQCGLCLPHCPTYRLDRIEAEGPRGRIAYAKALAEGTLAPTDTGDVHLDHCLGCRRCETACPAGVQYEELLIAARSRQFARKKPEISQRLALSALARPTVGRVALPLARLVGRLPAAPSPGAAPVASRFADGPIDQIGIFVGCVARDYEAGTRAGLAALLARLGHHACEVPDQGCCGTAAAHAGDAGTATRLAEANRRAFAASLPDVVLHDADLGPGTDALARWPERRTVVCLASGCQSVLAKSLDGIAHVEDVFSFLDRHGERLAFRKSAGRVALHVPCSQRVLENDAPLRRLLARIPGLDLVELPDTGCCGAAGLHMLAEPARAAALRAPLLEALAASGATRLLSANIGCRLHLGNASSIPVRHPIDFLAEHLA
jgi:glycolate oxidase iron-sulfur subunit